MRHLPCVSKLDRFLVVAALRRFLIGAGLVLALTVASGCGHGKAEPSYGVSQVQEALRAEHFDVRLVLDRRPGANPDGNILGLLNLFSGLKGLQAVLADGPAKDGGFGGEISAWIFDTRRHGDALNGGNVHLQKSNVVILTTREHEAAARTALAQLR